MSPKVAVPRTPKQLHLAFCLSLMYGTHLFILFICATYFYKYGDKFGHERTKVWTYSFLNAQKFLITRQSGHRYFLSGTAWKEACSIWDGLDKSKFRLAPQPGMFWVKKKYFWSKARRMRLTSKTVCGIGCWDEFETGQVPTSNSLCGHCAQCCHCT